MVSPAGRTGSQAPSGATDLIGRNNHTHARAAAMYCTLLPFVAFAVLRRETTKGSGGLPTRVTRRDVSYELLQANYS